LFPIFTSKRDALQAYLKEKGVQTQIHYPIPPHKQKCYKSWNHLSFPITERIAREELSIPMGPCLTMEEVQFVVAAVNDFSFCRQS